MNHWTERYVGLPVGEGFDCAELARLVNREVFGREIQVPGERDYIGAESVRARFSAMQSQIAQELPACAEPTDAPVDGDGVLIKARGYLQHVGIYCLVDGEPCVLHAADMKVGPQVVRQRIREMPIRGLHIEGFYRWI